MAFANMLVSVRSDYALLAIFDLARQKSAKPERIADIASRQKIPQKFLELILAGLRQAGLVESRRGADGGYLLARPPESITVGDVLRAVEGTPGKSRTRRKAETPLSDMWRRVNSAISSIVDETSFAELTRKWDEKQSEYVHNWDI